MSVIKNENKEIYDGIKLNTESKGKIIDELVEKIESNSNDNISELDGARRERMNNDEMKKYKVLRTVKTALVAIGSIAATFAIVVGVANYNNSNKKMSRKNVVTESVKSNETLGETTSEVSSEIDNAETQSLIEEANAVEDDKKFWDNCEYSKNFEEISRPDYISEKKGYKGNFEFEYSECDIDGDGKKDVVNLKMDADKDETAKGTVVVSINGKSTNTLEFDRVKQSDFQGDIRNCKLIKLWDGSCFVYFDIANLTSLTYQTMFSLKDYKIVMDSTNLPYMSSLRDIVINKETSGIYFFYWTQLNYVAGNGYSYYIEYYKGKFQTGESNYANVSPFKVRSKGNNLVELDSSFRQEYVLSEDREFYLDEYKVGRKILLKKGEKLTYTGVRFNMNARKNEKNAYGYSSAYDMCSFYVDDIDGSGKMEVFLDPLEEGKDYHETEIFDNISWAQ